MNNKELIASLAARNGLTKTVAADLLAAAVEEVLQSLEQGNEVSIPNVGILEVRKKNERVSVNPKTQVRSVVPPKLAVAFKPSAVLKSQAKNKD